MKATPNKKITVVEDMICPATKLHCDDECCTVGSECNVSGNNIQDCEKEQNIAMSNKITPEALIEMGFEKGKEYYELYLTTNDIHVSLNMKVVYLNGIMSTATTIEDIKDLIRLFK